VLHQRQLVVERERRLGPQPFGERVAIHVLHDDERLFLIRHEVVHLDNVRVRELRRRASLAKEPLSQLEIALVVGLERLDGHQAAQVRVARQVQRSHAAAAKPALDRVLADAFQ
jgi:hypothetical protein